VPGPEKHFLINPFGLMFQEVTASNIIKVDIEGRKLSPSPWDVWEAGYVVHSSVHRAREDVVCVMHTHTEAGVAVSCLKEGLLPLDMSACMYTGRIAYHDLEGITTNRDECERITADLGEKYIMILRNHGLLTCGSTIANAFQEMYQLEQACKVQLRAQSSGAELNLPPASIAETVRRQGDPGKSNSMNRQNQLQWQAMRRWMEKLDPSFME
jgi:ribulose-5-phosphate 4-epimerase/fuculose-1-phosphate aldolase